MELATTYQQTLDYLYSFVDFSMTKAVRYSPDQFNLERMFSFMQEFANPQNSYPIIHIAGTKGKGSTAAMCTSVLQAAGYKVGLYTSPHLVDYAERIQVNGAPIPHDDLVQLVAELRPYLDQGTQLTTFEITTGLAFLYFARQQVQAAVIEVGLGGRLDATNIVQPTLSVITSLSYDHTQFLGDTLAEIAGEKAGIIKPGVPVVLSPQVDEARHVIQRIAAERGSPLFEVGRDFLFTGLTHSIETGQTLLIWPKTAQPAADHFLDNGQRDDPDLALVRIHLLGQHQIVNAATAYTALQIFQQRALPIASEAIERGFASAVWPARFEIIQADPPVVLDCAHNRDSALKLRLALDDYFPGRPVVLVFGASEDKDIDGMFAELLPRISQVIATRSFHPRAADPQMLVALAHQAGRPARVIDKVEDALEVALEAAVDGAMVLVTGSIFVAAAVRDTWYNRKR